MKRLEGKHTLITGASQGLGRQLAIDFARASGNRVIAVGTTVVRALESVAKRAGL